MILLIRHYKFAYIFLIVFSFGCNRVTSNCEVNITQLLQTQGKLLFVSKYVNGFANELRDQAKDSTTGGYYSFYQNGNLKSYDFLVKNDTSIYSEQYDSLGFLMYMGGNPLLFKSINLKDDSLTIKLYLFSLNKLYKDISLVISRHKTIHLQLHKDTLFSNAEIAQYVIYNLHHERDIGAYIDVLYEIKCTKEIKSFRDSINLHYKPKPLN